MSYCPSTTEKSEHTLLVLALELLNEVVDNAVVKILTTKMGITSGGLDLENALLDGQERNIESSSTEIKNQNVTFADDLLVETVGNSGSSGLVDNTEYVHAGNGPSIFGGLTLRVVEVGRNGYDGIVDGGTEIRLSSLLHLQKHH